MKPNYPWHGIIGWSFEADLHCNGCAIARFGEATLFDAEATDCEGNPLHPVFSWDESDASYEYCGDCLASLREG